VKMPTERFILRGTLQNHSIVESISPVVCVTADQVVAVSVAENDNNDDVPEATVVTTAQRVAHGVSMLEPQNSIRFMHSTQRSMSMLEQQSDETRQTKNATTFATCCALCCALPFVLGQLIISIMVIVNYMRIAPKCKRVRSVVMVYGFCSLAMTIFSNINLIRRRNQSPDEQIKKGKRDCSNWTGILGLTSFVYMCYGFHIFHMDGRLNDEWGPGSTNPERCGKDAFEALDILYTIAFSFTMVGLILACCAVSAMMASKN